MGFITIFHQHFSGNVLTKSKFQAFAYIQIHIFHQHFGEVVFFSKHIFSKIQSSRGPWEFDVRPEHYAGVTGGVGV